jgi:hypothetical protein
MQARGGAGKSNRSAGVIRTRGAIEGMGSFVEEAKVMDGGKRFVTHGRVTTADGRVLSLD